ncbi:hypothetical protein HAX54_026062 [Datura stramonium]|uniref:Uncharacterized protein n=1 Tax=Datura stramonium TaxID=4076 RepID=A0ABS8V1U8_DATST|nr:hypothetical protein [Datura stramonium]
MKEGCFAPAVALGGRRLTPGIAPKLLLLHTASSVDRCSCALRGWSHRHDSEGHLTLSVALGGQRLMPKLLLLRAAGSVDKQAPRASSCTGVVVHRVAGRASMTLYYFGLDLALFIPSSSNSFQKLQIHQKSITFIPESI